jgi:hypothetical protein
MPPTNNQRSFERETFAGPPVSDLVLMQSDGTTIATEVKPFDLSPRGIGFHHAHPLPTGSLCQFSVKRNGVVGEVTGRVTRCEREPDGRYAIGVKFLVVRRPAGEGKAAGPGTFNGF